MKVLLPWPTLSALPIREGLVTLTERMGTGASGERATRAYVALRMLQTRIHRLYEPTDIEIHWSVTAVSAVLDFAVDRAWTDLAEILKTALEDRDEETSGTRRGSPVCRPEETVRARRQGLQFKR